MSTSAPIPTSSITTIAGGTNTTPAPIPTSPITTIASGTNELATVVSIAVNVPMLVVVVIVTLVIMCYRASRKHEAYGQASTDVPNRQNSSSSSSGSYRDLTTSRVTDNHSHVDVTSEPSIMTGNPSHVTETTSHMTTSASHKTEASEDTFINSFYSVGNAINGHARLDAVSMGQTSVYSNAHVLNAPLARYGYSSCDLPNTRHKHHQVRKLPTTHEASYEVPLPESAPTPTMEQAPRCLVPPYDDSTLASVV